MVAVNNRTREQIIQLAIDELRRNGHKIGDLLPCSVTIHLPPCEGRDKPRIEITAKLR